MVPEPASASLNFDQPIAIFPLPNAVLLPRAILPLHLFEPRYRDMARHALAGGRLVAMALLRPGYEERYYTHIASIHSVVCVGYILQDERLADGRYNILLQGICRATVRREDRSRTYRRGWLEPIPTGNGVSKQAARAIRRRLIDALDPATLAHVSATGVLLKVVRSPHLPISDVLDLLAYNLFETSLEKQHFLDEPDIAVRADRLISMLAENHRAVCADREASSRRCAPFYSSN